MNNKNNLEELIHWKDFTSGDENAFSVLFKLYYPELFNFGKIYTRDKCIINDSIQELFLDFWEKRERLSSDVNVSSYIFAGFRNKLFKQINQGLIFKSFKKGELEVYFDLSIEEIIIQREIDLNKILKINTILNQLSNKQKEVIYLKFYKGNSNEQIAQILKINYQSVKNYVFRSLQIFRDELQIN